MEIEKKTWPEAFQKVLDGEKDVELRLADFECESGDILILREYDPDKKEFTGRVIKKKINYVMKTNKQKYWSQKEVNKYGFLVMSLKDL